MYRESKHERVRQPNTSTCMTPNKTINMLLFRSVSLTGIHLSTAILTHMLYVGNCPNFQESVDSWRNVRSALGEEEDVFW